MHLLPTRLSTLSTRYLPALLVPALLTASTAAHAALDISTGFISAQTVTSVGFDFEFGLDATLTHGGVAHPTTIEFSCVVDTVAHDVDCDGVMTLGSAAIGVTTRFDGATDRGEWTHASGASPGLQSAHDDWGDYMLGDFIPIRDEVILLEDGYYFWSGWIKVYEKISGMHFDTSDWDGWW